MNRINKHQLWNGFTLIELLVVISIISMLSSIVIASLSRVRNKAENANTIQIIRQYITILDSIKINTGYYPSPGSLNPDGWVCLGKPPNGSYCLYKNGTAAIYPNPSFDDLLRQYYPNLPSPNPNPIYNDNIDTNYGRPYMSGSAYSHTCPTCGARIIYLLKGNNQNCLLYGAAGSQYGEGTYCDLTIPH